MLSGLRKLLLAPPSVRDLGPLPLASLGGDDNRVGGVQQRYVIFQWPASQVCLLSSLIT